MAHDLQSAEHKLAFGIMLIMLLKKSETLPVFINYTERNAVTLFCFVHHGFMWQVVLHIRYIFISFLCVCIFFI